MVITGDKRVKIREYFVFWHLQPSHKPPTPPSVADLWLRTASALLGYCGRGGKEMGGRVGRVRRGMKEAKGRGEEEGGKEREGGRHDKHW